MKNFYSCIDNSLVVPQPVQHLVIKNAAEKVGGSISFYGSEETLTLKKQSFIKSKLRRTPGLDGVVFFTFHQFRYNGELNVRLIREILGLKLEVHFAREGISLRTLSDLDALHPFLFSIDYTLRRDASAEWKQFVKSCDTRRACSCTNEQIDF